MASITPASAEIIAGQTQQFTADFSAKWTMAFGSAGTVDGTGLYTAPSTPGSEVVRAHSAIYGAAPSGITKNTDESVSVTSNTGTFETLTSNISLQSVGDKLDLVFPSVNDWNFRFSRAGQSYQINQSTIYYNSATQASWSATAGVRLRFELINDLGTTRLRITNLTTSTVLHTFTAAVGGAIQFDIIAYTPTTNGQTFVFPTAIIATGYTEVTAAINVLAILLTPREGLELYCQGSMLTLANDAPVASFTDQSGKGRHLTASTSQPVFKTSDSRVQFSGSNNPLLNSATFTVACGWMVAKYDDVNFSGFDGLLTDLTDRGVLVGNDATPRFYAFPEPLFEYRLNDRIYPAASNAQGPMNAFKLIFFRYWQPVTFNGVQIGQDRLDNTRRWQGSVKFLALYSRLFTETEIRSISASIAAAHSLTLADVFPFQADYVTAQALNKKVLRSGGDEFAAVRRVKRNKKRKIRGQFSIRRDEEMSAVEAYWDSHHPNVSFLYRDYTPIPPVDTEVFTVSDEVVKSSSGVNAWNYTLDFREI